LPSHACTPGIVSDGFFGDRVIIIDARYAGAA